MNLNSADNDPDPNTTSDPLGNSTVNNSGEEHPVAEPKVMSHYIGLGLYRDMMSWIGVCLWEDRDKAAYRQLTY